MPEQEATNSTKQGWLGGMRQKWRDRRKNAGPHRSFRPTPKQKHNFNLKGVREGWQLIVDSFLFIKRWPKIFWPIIVLYGVLAYFLVGGISQFDYVAFRQTASDAAQGSLDAVSTSISLFGATVLGGLNQEPNELQQFLSGLLMLLFWLALIWAVRMLSADKPIKVREAFYNSASPLVSTLVILLVMVVQLIPAGLGLFALAVATGSNWINGPAEGLAFVAAAVLLGTLSFYLLTSSLIATMIVALPGTYPWHALTSARTLVLGRRWSILLRILAAVVIQLLIWTVVLLPIILLESWLRVDWLPLVPVVVQLLSGFTLVFSSVYIYKLYRSLL